MDIALLRNTEMTWPPAWREWLFDELSVTRRCEDLQEDCMSRQVLRPRQHDGRIVLLLKTAQVRVQVRVQRKMGGPSQSAAGLPL